MRIIEILGLAGSGKSTACALLRRQAASQAPEFRVDRRRLPRAIGRLAIDVGLRRVAGSLRDPAGGFQGLRLAAHMHAMVRDLESRKRTQNGFLFLDQGPLFNCVSAARLAATGQLAPWVPVHMSAQLFANIDFLDSIVFLDAENETLLSRIDSRTQDHRIKGKNPAEMSAFLDDYRVRFEDLFERIQRTTSISPFRIDTAEASPEEVVARIRSHFGVAASDARGAATGTTPS